MNTHVALLESIARLGLALLLGSIIGLERPWRQKMAVQLCNVRRKIVGVRQC